MSLASDLTSHGEEGLYAHKPVSTNVDCEKDYEKRKEVKEGKSDV